MKQITKTYLDFMLIVVFSVLSLFVSADSFRYDFEEDLKDDDWELWGSHSIWQVKDGFLRTTIQAPDFFTIGLFQFKGIPGNYEVYELFADDRVIHRQVKKPGYESFTIVVNNIGSKQAQIGVAIGRRFPNMPREPHFYIFDTYFIHTQTYNWDLPSWWTHEEPLHPDTIWDTGELASMEIRFNKGHFQWFADDEKRAEFEDPEFSTIEIIGFMVISDGVHVGSAWIDSFTISGPGLSVSPQAKLASTWGKYKQLR